MKKIKKITIEYDDGVIDEQFSDDKQQIKIMPFNPERKFSDFFINSNDFCVIEDYFRKNPDAQSAMIACSCRKCTVWC